jgi:hypothetical protein
MKVPVHIKKDSSPKKIRIAFFTNVLYFSDGNGGPTSTALSESYVDSRCNQNPAVILHLLVRNVPELHKPSSIRILPATDPIFAVPSEARSDKTWVTDTLSEVETV